MNAVAEQTDLDTLIRKASPQSRRLAMQTLIGTVMEETNFEPQLVLDSAGRAVGLFIPHYNHKPTAPPLLSPDEEAELVRRLETPENSVEAEEFIKLVELELARISPRR